MQPFPGSETEVTQAAADGSGASALVWLIALAAIALFALFGAVLSFHWFRYSLHNGSAVLSLMIYVIGGGVLIMGVLGGAAAL